MHISRKVIVWTAMIGVTVAGVAALLRPRRLDVEAASVERRALRIAIDEQGETRLRRKYLVSAPVAGRVLRVEAQPGDAVRAGQVVATITPPAPAPLDARARLTAEARVQTAEAELARAKAEQRGARVSREQAERDMTHARTLLPAGAVARLEVEQLESRVEAGIAGEAAADAAVRTAASTVAEARAALASSGGATRSVAVRLPVDGVVLRRLLESEAVSVAGTPLVEIGDLADLEIVVDLQSGDAVRVKAGDEVAITEWGGAHGLKGRVRRVDPSGFTKVSALGVEEQRVDVVVDFVDPPGARPRLGDGFRVTAAIVVSDRPSVLTVPTPALFRANGQWAVFVVRRGVATRVFVRVGEQNADLAEILDGVPEGERVVMYPGESLADGLRVVAHDAEP